ncbi:OLC1v1025838C1 [Oldenlandia corymbosa var. corymbosa]|uniref:OLC1v1025838C1 n=1 Tax=Oldenlandia corymbosa var. corymbosa TaxID=529605 RepID=A0AAV1C5M1_OLDCO|nr:OLC1v1025838C1 [Oldenlandia corymbosa var. corymbosa]
MKATSLAGRILPPALHSRSAILRNPSDSIPVVHFSKLHTSLFPCRCEFRPFRGIFTVCSSKLPSVDSNVAGRDSNNLESEADFNVEEVRSSVVPANVPSPSLSLSDQAFFLLSFIACTTVAAMVGFVAAAVPAMFAMRRSAIALAKLAVELRKEMPSTMAAVRVTGIEISDLILELSELSQEISDGVSKSTQVVQAADAGIRQIGSLARERTLCMVTSIWISSILLEFCLVTCFSLSLVLTLYVHSNG